jgi:DNA-binding winged helix-turn-helix (wHTH) protein
MMTSHDRGEATRSPPGTTVLFGFDDFTLDVAEYRLSREGRPIEVQPQAFDALRYLVEHRDRAVTADELQREIWSDADVDKGAVWWTMYRLRRILGQRTPADGPIRTLGRRGYRFTAHVHVEVRAPLADRPELGSRPEETPSARRIGGIVRAALLRDARRALDREGAGSPEASVTFATLADGERTRRALALLERDEVSIATVAERVGYASVPTFTRAFRSWIGTTPQIYRRDYAVMMRASVCAGLLAEDDGAAELTGTAE